MENYKNSMRNLILTAKSGGNLPNSSEVGLSRVRSGRNKSNSNSPNRSLAGNSAVNLHDLENPHVNKKVKLLEEGMAAMRAKLLEV